MIRLEGVTKRYPGRPAPALDEVDLEVRDGELLGLVGTLGLLWGEISSLLFSSNAATAFS